MAARVQQRVKKTLISPFGDCAHHTADCSGDGGRATTYKCGLGRAGGPHTGGVMLFRSQIKLLPVWISWWVSKAFARRAACTAAAEVPWLQHSERDTNWVSQVIAFCSALGLQKAKKCAWFVVSQSDFTFDLANSSNIWGRSDNWKTLQCC